MADLNLAYPRFDKQPRKGIKAILARLVLRIFPNNLYLRAKLQGIGYKFIVIPDWSRDSIVGIAIDGNTILVNGFYHFAGDYINLDKPYYINNSEAQ